MEFWTAVSEQDDLITFNVVKNGEERQEKRYKSALPLMFQLGGYPVSVGIVMSIMPFPWSFRKDGDAIYVDVPK